MFNVRKMLYGLFNLVPDPNLNKIKKLDIYEFKIKKFNIGIYNLLKKHNIDEKDVMWAHYSDYVKLEDTTSLFADYRIVKVPDSYEFIFLIPRDKYWENF